MPKNIDATEAAPMAEPELHPLLSEAWLPGVPHGGEAAAIAGESTPPEPEPEFIPNPPRPPNWWHTGMAETTVAGAAESAAVEAGAGAASPAPADQPATEEA